MVRALSTWLYNRDPLMPLRFEGPLSTLKEQLRDSPTYMQDLLQHYLLENPHRSTVVLYPDAQYNQRLEAAEKRACKRPAPPWMPGSCCASPSRPLS
ncbi:MAG: hypothetical protein R2932_02490 [Caldilineaceae bacterium]